MKIKIIIGLILLLPWIGHSQGEWDNWYFGVHAGMNFASGSPVALPTNAFSQSATLTTTSISDSTGNFLFYSDGTRVYNKNQLPMPNGFLGITHAKQPSFAVQRLTNPDQYYLFAAGEYAGGTLTGFRYSLIDMRLQSGLGDVVDTVKNIPLPLGDSAVHQLNAIRHKNNKDVWVVVMSHGSQNKYLAYLVTSSGINLAPVVSNSLLNTGIEGGFGNYHGNLRISPDGTKLVCSDSLAEFCEFNPETGVVTPKFLFRPTYLGLSYYEYKAEFSIDSRFLYLARHTDNPLTSVGWQFDTNLPDSAQFVQSQYIIGLGSGGQLQMATDWKIYIDGDTFLDSLSVINNPSLPGPACGYQRNAVSLEGNYNNGTLPQFLQRYKAYIHYNGHCYPNTTFLSGDIHPPADSIHWDFGDPASGLNNFSNEPSPSHKFTQPGQYTIELFVRHNDTRTDTSWRTITIYDTPTPALGEDITICQGDSVTFDAGSFPGCSYSWDNLTTGQAGIDTGQTFTTGVEGIYAVTVTSPQDCIGRDTAQLMVVAEALVFVTPPTLSLCSDNTTSLALNSNITSATFSWSAIASSPLVTGYSAGTGNTIAQTLVNTDTIPQIVTYNITPQNANCPFVPLDYPVTVNPLPDVYFVPGTLSICSGETATVNLFSHVSGTTYSWTAAGSSGYVSGYASGTGSIIDQLLINSGADTEYVTYYIVSTSADDCIGIEINYTVTVLPTVVVTITPPTTEICSGETTGIDLQCSLSGCSFTWTAVASSPNVTGYSPGSGNAIQQILINSSPTPQTVTYSITPSITGCGSVTTDYIATVNPLLPVSIFVSSSANPECEEIPITFTGAAMNGGSTPVFQWQVNGTNTGMNNTVFTYVPSDGDVVTCILTSSEPCTSGNPASSNPFIMTVVESPDVTFFPCFDIITTTNAKPIKLRGGIPLNGTYSGTGVDPPSGIWYPAIAGPGIHEIKYTYINDFGCTDSAKHSISNIQYTTFNCGDNLVDVRDSSIYPTVEIGGQCWFAANLDYGTEIAYTIPQHDNCLPEKYSRPSSLVPHPSFYQWDEVMQYQDTEEVQGLCPPGWHVPSEADWNTLFANWTNSAFSGEPLKYSGYSGFNAFLNGVGFFNNNWWFEDVATFFWSSTSHGPYKAWAHGMHQVNFSVSYYPSYRSNAFAVRCVRD